MEAQSQTPEFNSFFKKTRHSFSFISLVSPFLVNNIRFLSYNDKCNKKKVVVKQSYMLLTWFYYLTFLNQTNSDKYRLKFAILPIKRKIFTLTRAPMAHKNWSKEQYKFQFCNFKISFNSGLKKENNIFSLNAALLFVILTKQTFPQFETNLLFLKTVSIFFYAKDSNYFNYNKFINL